MSQPEIKINDRLLVRLRSDNNALDEVVAFSEYGECEFHLEQMDEMQWWMRWYSTKGNGLPRELIVRIGPTGGIYEFEQVHCHQLEHHEHQTPPENITHEVEHFIRYFGMKKLLEEMLNTTQTLKQEENLNWPDRDTSYLDKLAGNLLSTLRDYDDRYPGDPDYEESDQNG